MDKKASILYIKEILEKKTNEENCLTIPQIRDILKDTYGIDLEVKAVGRNIKCLADDVGLPIEKTGKGFYLIDREYDDTELKLIVDSILSNRFIPKKNTDQLIKKLYDLTGPKLREMTPYIESYNKYSKTGNQAVFLNIELVEEAIKKNVRIEFQYCDYNRDKQLVPRHDGVYYEASPYRLIVKQQRYYLMSNHHHHSTTKKDNLAYFKLDKMVNIRILENVKAANINTLPSFTHGINDQVLHDYLPYPFSDKPVEITLDLKEKTTAAGIDTLCEWFGDNLTFSDCSNGRVRARVKASPNAMCFFCLQYIDMFKVVTPASLAAQIKDKLERGLSDYNSSK